MKTQRRWMKWVLEVSAADQAELPFARGVRRAAMIEARSGLADRAIA